MRYCNRGWLAGWAVVQVRSSVLKSETVERLIVMTNSLPLSTPPPGEFPRVCQFDLKGSTRGRRANPPSKGREGWGWGDGDSGASTESSSGNLVLKDLDWLELMASPLLLDSADEHRALMRDTPQRCCHAGGTWCCRLLAPSRAVSGGD
jgi:hypothetical protein